MSAGYYGQKIHVFCERVVGLPASAPVFVFHHDNFATCANYARLQTGLSEQGLASCCVERPGFGLSPLPQMMSEMASLKGESALLVEAVVQKVGDEHENFVAVGHGVGGVFAWATTKLVPRLHRGLILLDGMTPPAFHSCPDVNRFYSKRPGNMVQQVLQQSGLRRLITYFRGDRELSMPLGVSPALSRWHRALMLTDKMWFATNTAFALTKRTAEQLVGLTPRDDFPVAFLVSNTGRSRSEGFPFMECFNDQGAKLVQRLFKRSLVLPVRQVGHFSLTTAVDELVQSAKFIIAEDAKIAATTKK